MALVDELKTVFIVVWRTIKDVFSDIFGGSSLGRYIRPIVMLLAIILLGAGGYMGYRFYIVSREQKAHATFADYMQEFQAAIKTDSTQEWERMARLFDHGYMQHQGSNVAPLFLSLKADALIKQGQTVEGVNTLQQAIDALAADSPLSSLLQIKQALIQLDADDESLSQTGLQKLLAVARDKENPFKDMALFYLGRYYWANDQIEDAKNSWQELEDNSWYDKAYPSPWMQEVKQKLQEVRA